MRLFVLAAALALPTVRATCSNMMQDGNETGVDCPTPGPTKACNAPTPPPINSPRPPPLSGEQEVYEELLGESVSESVDSEATADTPEGASHTSCKVVGLQVASVRCE